MLMTGIVPFKTPQGHDELARRTRRLGQRHRTVLLLVDGRRSVDQVLMLARAAGVGEQHYRDLVEMALVALPEGASAPTLPISQNEPELDDEPDSGPDSAFHVELPIDAAPDDAAPPVRHGAPTRALQVLTEEVVTSPAEPAGPAPTAAPAETEAAARARAAVVPETTAPVASAPAQTSLPDSVPTAFEAATLPRRVDAPLEAARELLLRAVREQAPVVGQLTLMKLKRAVDRGALDALLDEVEQHISRPRKRVAAAQTLRHARHLLGTPTSTSFTML